jgi:DNA-binding NarL/FixJ family response regulator
MRPASARVPSTIGLLIGPHRDLATVRPPALTPPPTPTPTRTPAPRLTPTQTPTRRSVAIVDDQPITRGGLEALAAMIPGLMVTASVASINELDVYESGYNESGYDMVVIDAPTGADGLSLDAIKRLSQISRLLIISNWDRPPSLLAAIRAGAHGCVTRQSDHAAVTSALNVVAAGGYYLCERLVGQFHLELNRPPRADQHGLAPREVETLQWIARGYTHAQIATCMGLTQATINTYAKRIRGKLKVTSKAELTRMAIDLGHVSERHHDLSAARAR